MSGSSTVPPDNIACLSSSYNLDMLAERSAIMDIIRLKTESDRKQKDKAIDGCTLNIFT
jgi:hypothetical protein